MIITIDGPAGTGKSSVAQAAARQLGFDFLDTGAMYRAIGLAVIRAGAKLDDAGAIASIAAGCRVSFDWTTKPPGVTLNDESIGHLVRTQEVSSAASIVSAVPSVRQLLVPLQQQIGRERPNLVTEGRDQGTVVFPAAEVKFYLDATPEERAKRRFLQLKERGVEADVNRILAEIIERDTRDASRAVGPMAVPKDARYVDTTRLSLNQVIELVVGAARARQGS